MCIRNYACNIKTQDVTHISIKMKSQEERYVRQIVA